MKQTKMLFQILAKIKNKLFLFDCSFLKTKIMLKINCNESSCYNQKKEEIEIYYKNKYIKCHIFVYKFNDNSLFIITEYYRNYFYLHKQIKRYIINKKCRQLRL